jgi:hypothetical protein
MDLSFAIDMLRSNLCFTLCLLERGVQVTTYDFEFMDNSIDLIALYLILLKQIKEVIISPVT